MNTISLYVSKMCMVGALFNTIIMLIFLSQFEFGAAAIFAALTTLMVLLSAVFHMQYNRFRAELRQMADEPEPVDYHMYSSSDVGGGPS